MKRLTCEMCGSTDLMKQDGVFVCQSCGCKYSVEEARKMMVEGTVSVSDPVQTDSSHLISNYFKLANKAYDSDNEAEAEEYCNKIIEVDPNNYQAWMLKGKTAGWQSTLANVRFSESVSDFSEAIKNASDEAKKELTDEAASEIEDMARALVISRAKQFEKYPDAEETKVF